MTLTRRRFLAIAAAAVAAGPAAAETAWRGRALGAEVEITLRGGDRGATAAALAAAARACCGARARSSSRSSRSATGCMRRPGGGSIRRSSRSGRCWPVPPPTPRCPTTFQPHAS